jgi:predicted RNA-binding Zn ribbon-like protein
MPLTPQQFLKKGHGKTGPWMDLVNSEEWDTYGQRTDYLDSPSWLPFFLKQWHFAASTSRLFPLSKFKSLRAALRNSCEAIAAGRDIPPAALRALNGALNVTGKHQVIQRQNGSQIQFVPLSEGWDWILAQTALSFALLLTHGQGSRVKICRNPNCRWVFYDSTKARTRCWCNDKVCGNRDRVRRSRSRHPS